MKSLYAVLVLLVTVAYAPAQDIQAKNDSVQHIQEVSVTATRKIETDLKKAVSIDGFLADNNEISFIKRGAYAWEPLLHNMSVERATVTIDGMHIFGACTDKMDPITSYLESNNLSGITITSGQEGSLHGSTIAGGIDLQRKSTRFGLEKKWHGSVQTGFEGNNKQVFNLGNLSYSDEKLAADGSIALRKAGNYYAGNNTKVNHSQYQKLNASLGLAYKTGGLSSIRLDALYDKAENVGFPALPMDLWLSRALITSVAYQQVFEESLFDSWDTKLYFNAIEHYMDDSSRPENLVHMDMPGWSNTYGLVSRLDMSQGRYRAQLQLNAYQNLSIAEMTMYPQDRSKKTMFAYSWPWVTTRYTGGSIRNTWDFSERSRLNFGGSLGWNFNHVKYGEFNRIFYPEASQEKNRILPAVFGGYSFRSKPFHFSVGTGYGHRAPSVSEGYGYYIYNSFDRYDYIGNPDLKNEISYDINTSAGFQKGKVGIELTANYFHIRNYIVGEILSLGSPMNYQSVGVKGYSSLRYATLFNTTLRSNYAILQHVHWKGALTYARGLDDRKENLPFIRPLTYQTSLHLMLDNLSIQTALQGDFVQKNYSPTYGEDQTKAYCIWGLSADYTFIWQDYRAVLQVGAENILDSYYSSYADWGDIPRMGRNIFTSLKIQF